MADLSPAVRKLMELPRSDRRTELESLVIAEFKSTLYMDEDEGFPVAESFFDMGLTSLRLTEIKERLEALLGREIDANSLFNSPTLDALMDHITTDAVPELFAGQTSTVAAGASVSMSEVDDLLKDLYQ